MFLGDEESSNWLGTSCITVIHFQGALHSLLRVTTISQRSGEEIKQRQFLILGTVCSCHCELF